MAEKFISEKTYVAVFIALLILTLSTYEAAKLNLGHWNAPVGIAILDEHFTYTTVNPAYCALTGYAPEE